MKAICLIGTSHLAALKHGSVLLEASSDYRFDYFGWAETGFGSMSVVRGCLVPDERAMRQRFSTVSGGSDRIEIGAYDAFAIVGLFGIPQLLQTCWYMQNTYTTDIRTPLDDRTLLSPAAFNATVDGRMTWEQGLNAARQLRAATKAPLFAIFSPRLAKPGMSPQSGDFMTQPGYRELFQQIHHRYFERLRCEGLEIVDQPPSTIVDEFLTDPRYNTDAPFMMKAERRTAGDISHMNADFGALVLEQLLGRLGIPSRRAKTEEARLRVARAG